MQLYVIPSSSARGGPVSCVQGSEWVSQVGYPLGLWSQLYLLLHHTLIGAPSMSLFSGGKWLYLQNLGLGPWFLSLVQLFKLQLRRGDVHEQVYPASGTCWLFSSQDLPKTAVEACRWCTYSSSSRPRSTMSCPDWPIFLATLVQRWLRLDRGTAEHRRARQGWGPQ